MDKISVIVPIYKVEPYLHKCIDSILAQDYRPLEVILVDDGSPDKCGDICDEYAKRDDRIRVIHQQNRGLSGARNAGLEIATGDWVTFVDSDDWLSEGCFSAAILAMDKYGAKSAIVLVRETDGVHELALRGAELPELVSPEEVYSRCDVLAVWAWGKFFRRDDIGTLRFPEGLIQEDEFFTHKVLFKYSEVAIVKSASYNYLHRSDSIVGGKWYPQRLLALDGMKDQLQYFEERHLATAERHVRVRMIKWLVLAAREMSRDCPNDMLSQSYILKELRRVSKDARYRCYCDSKMKKDVLQVLHPSLVGFIDVWYLFCVIREEGPMAAFRKIAYRLRW